MTIHQESVRHANPSQSKDSIHFRARGTKSQSVHSIGQEKPQVLSTLSGGLS
jgi:hypothetical protein